LPFDLFSSLPFLLYEILPFPIHSVTNSIIRKGACFLGQYNTEFLFQMNIYIDYIMIYQLEGRYPENEIDSPTQEISEDYFHQTKEFMEWLIKKL